jgi:hypothetical protein
MILAPGRWILLVLLATLVAVTAVQPAHAIPVFARKYETSCQTCHVAYPKLTPFGEAFRRNGYRWPAGQEEDSSKDEPIALGHAAHKKVFPNAVWPSQITGQVPLSAQIGSTVRYSPHEDASVDFANVGANLGINFSATFDETFSTWAGAGLRAGSSGATEAELERIIMVIQPFDGPLLNVRIGRFEAGASGFTIHRTLGIAPWYLTTPVGDSPFALDPTQVGMEINGILGGRMGYAVGLTEGAGTLNSAKDGFARLSYKIGGMRLDGVGGATEAEPWRETSLELGAFGYLGNHRIGLPGVAEQDDNLIVGGGDLNLLWRDLNVMGAFVFQQNSRPSLAKPGEQFHTWNAFVQTDYVVFPWFVPTLRYEFREAASGQGQRISGGAYVLLRANIRGQVLAATSDEGGGFDLDQVTAGLRMAF